MDDEKTKEGAWPVEDVDYHLVRLKRGVPAYSGYLAVYQKRSSITREVMAELLTDYEADKNKPAAEDDGWLFTTKPKKGGKVYPVGVWLIYPGRRPDKKWGPICP